MRRRAAWWELIASALTFVVSLCSPATVLAQSATSDQEKKKEEKKDEKKKDDNKKKQSPPAGSEPLDVNAERKNLSRVARSLADAFEGNSPRRITELLDERFYDFPRFEDQVTQFLQENREIRMYFRESTSEVKGDKATLIVDADMTFATKANPNLEQKRRERIQFDFVRTNKGWKIYEITPRKFFTP
jgi:hypothetical protein